jgi:hypothetical protein
MLPLAWPTQHLALSTQSLGCLVSARLVVSCEAAALQELLGSQTLQTQQALPTSDLATQLLVRQTLAHLPQLA